MSSSGLEKQMEIFLKQLLLMNVFFPMFITMTVVFFYVLGMGPSFLLGTTLFLLMGYNIIMARYGFAIYLDIKKDKVDDVAGKKVPA